MRPLRTVVAALVAAIAVMAVAACGTTATTDAPLTGASLPPTAISTAPLDSSEATAPTAESADGHTSLVARTDTELEVFASPGDASPHQTLPATTGFGSRRALLVVDDQGEWLEVMLPVRPNGSTGWIRRADVELRQIETAVVVDLDARTLTVTEAGEVVLETTVAVGDESSPTPTGRFSVVDKIDTADPDGPYGPFAFGLSGHSDVLTEFAGGDGQIGIHGTSDPSSIGRAASHGCIRVPNDIAVVLDSLLPLGTPVTIG
ncbi:MAG: L,D-transpeptidase [Acidimicrobiales bacterium]